MIDFLQRASIASGPQPGRSRQAWVLIGGLIFIQFLLFRQQVIRELLWAYPAHHDQANFLHQSQEIYFKMLDSGFWSGLIYGLQHSPPSSFMLGLQGSLVYYVFGPQRINALTLVFAYFALLQVTMAYTMRRLTGMWSMSLIALGLLIGTMSRFFYAGGLSDFRADGVASPLYGVTLCCFLLSNWLTDVRWSRVTICSAALLCWFRPIAGVYLAGIHILLLLFLLFRIWRSSDGDWARRVTFNLGKYGLLFAALVLPIPLIGGRLFYDYYVVGHVLSPEKKIRAAEQGVVTLSDNLLFYPRSLYDNHLGFPIVYLWLSLLAATAIFLLFCQLKYADAPGQTDERDYGVSWGVLVLWLLTPLAILTMNLSKSPLVASIALVPAVLLGSFLLYRMERSAPASTPPRFAGAFRAVLATLSLAGGMTLMANAEGRPDVHAPYRAEVKALLAAYDDIVTYCERFGLKQPVFVTDRILEYFNGTAAAVMMLERSGQQFQPREMIAYNIFERTKDEVVKAAAGADCALLTLDPIEKAQQSLFPFHQTAINWQAEYRRIVTTEMAPIAELRMPGHHFQIFVRPRARLEGGSYGWLTAEGAEVVASARALRNLPVVRITGSTIGSKHLKGELVTTATIAGDPGKPPVTLQSRATIYPDESYEIRIETGGAKLPYSGPVRLRLTFDRYFVPKDLGINADPRKLVIQIPKSTSLLPPEGTTAAPRQQLTVGDLYP